MKRVKKLVPAQLLLMLLDCVTVTAAGGLALLTRFDFSFAQVPAEFLEPWFRMLPAQLLITLAVFWLRRMYRYLWRYVSVHDVAEMALSVFLAYGASLIPVVLLGIRQLFLRLTAERVVPQLRPLSSQLLQGLLHGLHGIVIGRRIDAAICPGEGHVDLRVVVHRKALRQQIDKRRHGAVSQRRAAPLIVDVHRTGSHAHHRIFPAGEGIQRIGGVVVRQPDDAAQCALIVAPCVHHALVSLLACKLRRFTCCVREWAFSTMSEPSSPTHSTSAERAPSAADTPSSFRKASTSSSVQPRVERIRSSNIAKSFK